MKMCPGDVVTAVCEAPMFGSYDITFCMNRSCPLSNKCGRSVKRLDGKQVIVSMSSFAPDADGTCKHQLEYEEYPDQKASD